MNDNVIKTDVRDTWKNQFIDVSEQSYRLEQILESEQIERKYIECTTIGGIIAPIILMNKYKVYIYGGSDGVELVYEYLMYLGCDIKGIIDQDYNKRNNKVLNKIPYLLPKELIKTDFLCDSFIIINVGNFSGINSLEIYSFLKECRVAGIYVLDEYDKFQILTQNQSYKQKRFSGYFYDNRSRLIDVYRKLKDDFSKDIMCEYIRVFMQAGVYHHSQIDGKRKYFYGCDVCGGIEQLYTKKKDEVWINCGANVGDTIFSYFVYNKLDAKKIYAFEGDTNIFNRLVRNIEYLPSSKRQKIQAVNMYVGEETNFIKVIDEKVSLINADIEGAELDVLKALRHIIVKDRPVLAFCIYHKAEDLIEIPNYIDDLVSDYEFVIRKYHDSAASVNYAAELVLYAIPYERKAKLCEGYSNY